MQTLVAAPGGEEDRSGGGSEVARLRQQIELECQALQLQLRGFSQKGKHQFFQSRSEEIWRYKEELEPIVGEQQADYILCDIYFQVIG